MAIKGFCDPIESYKCICFTISDQDKAVDLNVRKTAIKKLI